MADTATKQLTPLEQLHQDVLAEYPDDEEIVRFTDDRLDALCILLYSRGHDARWGFLDEAREPVAGLRSSEAKVYAYTQQLEEAIARVDRREELYRRAKELLS